MKQRQESKPAEEKDPLVLIARDIITATIKDDCAIIAKESVNEITEDYLSEIHYRTLIKEKYLKKAIENVVFDAIEEIINE